MASRNFVNTNSCMWLKRGICRYNKLDNSYSRLGIETVERGCKCVYADTTSLIRPTVGYQRDFGIEAVACVFK